jgi:AmmeMemoRadiSam system protein A
MEPLSSPEASRGPSGPLSGKPEASRFGDQERALLLGLADASIRRGLEGARPAGVDAEACPPVLRQLLGVFVTVTVDGALNGCIGTVTAVEPLCDAVSRLAWEAAFDDPRLPALQAEDYPHCGIKISVLSEPEPIRAQSEAELIAALRPGIDGLILVDGSRRATFLPAVWEKVGDAAEFVAHLKTKAGIPASSWPPRISALRYTAEEFGGG